MTFKLAARIRLVPSRVLVILDGPETVCSALMLMNAILGCTIVLLRHHAKIPRVRLLALAMLVGLGLVFPAQASMNVT